MAKMSGAQQRGQRTLGYQSLVGNVKYDIVWSPGP